MTFSVFLEPQADIVADLLQVYFPNGCKSIDFTYGTGGFWWRIKESPLLAPLYLVTACDASPHKKLQLHDTIAARDLLKDDYSDLGLHDVGFFDPPYLINRASFDVPLHSKRGRMGFQGPKSWSEDDLGKYTANKTVGDFNRHAEGILRVAPQCLKRGGLLMVKIMDVRDNGNLIPHHITIANILSKSFKLLDVGIYIRQGSTTWKVKEGLQGLHGYWMIFRFSKEDSLI